MPRWIQYLIPGGLICGVIALAMSGDATPRANGQSAQKLPAIEPATHKSYVETFPGVQVKFEMLAIPGGTYLMGSPATEKGRGEDEGPQHPVTVRPFWMGKCEVTWDEYDLYWKKDGLPAPEKPSDGDKLADAVSKPTPPYADETFGHGREGNPVICVTHHAAMQYCLWLSAKTGKTYRLPTEAEWEWACRAGTTTPWFFGETPSKAADYAWYEGNSESLAHKVGEKKPNAWGLQDIQGNVSEWCLDQYKKDAYATFSTTMLTISPVFIPGPDRFPHVARGGSWADKTDQLRSAARRGSDKRWIRQDPQRPQSIWWLTDAEFVGFRIVRPLEEQENLKGVRSKITRESR